MSTSVNTESSEIHCNCTMIRTDCIQFATGGKVSHRSPNETSRDVVNLMRFVVHTGRMQLHRISPLLLAFVLILSACGGDDDGDDSTPSTNDQVEEDGYAPSDEVEVDEDAENDEADEDADDGDETVADDGDGLDEAGIDAEPIVITEAIIEMVDDANADGDVTGDEISEILEVASDTPAEQADCEGAILAELGVTDPTDIDQLRAAAAAMTEEQRAALSTCITGG